MKTEICKEKSIILLVEDEELLRRSISFTMMRLGYSVIAFSTVDQALDHIRLHDTQADKLILIITDLHLPGKSGFDLIRNIATLNKKIPILAITGQKSREIRNQLKSLGVEEILEKPFDLDELVTKVGSILMKFQIEKNKQQ